jgi:hypothetical protein
MHGQINDTCGSHFREDITKLRKTPKISLGPLSVRPFLPVTGFS